MARVFTPPALRCNGIKRVPDGVVELGEDYPTPSPARDRMDGVEREINQYIEQNATEMEDLNALSRGETIKDDDPGPQFDIKPEGWQK